MALPRIICHRYRDNRHSGHPNGVGSFALVRDYDEEEPVQFGGVLGGAGSLIRPTNLALLEHWLDVKEWRITVKVEPGEHGTPWPIPQTADLSDVIVPSGAQLDALTEEVTSEFEAGGDPVPAGREMQYHGNITTSVVFAWSDSNEVSGDGIYSRECTLNVALNHGSWGYHVDEGQFLLGLNVTLVDRSTYESEEFLTLGANTEDPNLNPSAACPEGMLQNVAETIPPPAGFDSWWTWECYLPPVTEEHVRTWEIDPDATEDIGTFFSASIKVRQKNEGVIINGTPAGASPVLELTIEPESYYSE